MFGSCIGWIIRQNSGRRKTPKDAIANAARQSASTTKGRRRANRETSEKKRFETSGPCFLFYVAHETCRALFCRFYSFLTLTLVFLIVCSLRFLPFNICLIQCTLPLYFSLQWLCLSLFFSAVYNVIVLGFCGAWIGICRAVFFVSCIGIMWSLTASFLT